MNDTSESYESRRRADLVRGLRDLAQFLEDHPDIRRPYNIQVDAFTDLADGRKSIHLSGSWRKDYFGSFVAYVKDFGPVEFHLNVSRDEVCRKVQTGTKVVPAVEEHEEPVWEWICSDPDSDALSPAATASRAGS